MICLKIRIIFTKFKRNLLRGNIHLEARKKDDFREFYSESLFHFLLNKSTHSREHVKFFFHLIYNIS